MRLFSLILLLSINALLGSTAKLKPLVVLPPSITWNSENTIIVTPNPNAYSVRVDIKAQITGSNGSANINQGYFQFGKQNVIPGEPVSLSTNVRTKSDFYTVTVSVTGHADFSMLVKGSPNIESVFLQSDKTFYRSNETVKLRALPLTSNGNLFHGKIKYVLKDPNGFAIRTITEKTGTQFVDLSFQLPIYLRYGRWKVVAMAQKSDQALGEVGFRVEDYVLPKFHVNVQVNDHNKQLYSVEVNILAKFPRGAKVSGDLLLYCSIVDEKNSTTTSNNQINKRVLLLTSKIDNGNWSQELNIRQCYNGDNFAKLEILAEVHEASTFKAETGSTFYEVLKPGFEVIPAKPAIVRSTKKIVLYVRPLSEDISIKESEIFVNFCCLSNDKNENGFQRNHTGYKLGGFLALDFDVNPNCVVHLYKIYRKLSDSTLSREEIVAIPLLDDNSTLRLSWLEPTDPAKILYYEGDVFEAHVTGGVRDLNYIVLCDSKHIVATGKVPDSNLISVPIQNGMKGACMIYAYKWENPKPKLDMILFLAESGSCPSEYQISVSSTNIAVNKEITMKMTAADRALGLVRAMDSRLEKMFHVANNFKRHFVFNFAEFNSDSVKNKQSAILSGFIDTTALLIEVDKICSLAGLYIPSLSPLRFTAGSSLISNLCVNRIVTKILERTQFRVSGTNYGRLNDSETTQRRISLAGVFGGKHTSFTATVGQPQNLQQKPIQNDDQKYNKAFENSELTPTNDFDSDELFLRDFFPEVWLFKDYTFGQRGIVEEKLLAPHSVSEWSFVSHFWSPLRKSVCKLPSLTVFTSRHLYMDLDIPKHVYENETIRFKLSINADKLDKDLSLALCVRGFNPVVCGNLGSEGKSDEGNYFGFTMGPTKLKVEREFFVKYLIDGDFDLQFELLDKETVLNAHLICDNNPHTYIFDKIKHTIHVSKRVDLDEHFRQVVIHRQRKPSNQLSISRATQMISFPDVIQFTDTSFDNGTSISSISIASTERIYDIALEFMKFSPSLPLRDLNTFVEMRNSPRKRRHITSLGSLSDVIGDLSLVTFQPKPRVNLQSSDDDLEENQQNEMAIGNLLSELLTYSDCHSADEPVACGFGEYGIPSSPQMRDIVLTSLATTLLCESSAAEQFICGPVKFLAEVIPQTSTSTSSFLEFLKFSFFQGAGRDSETFLRALLSWVGRECSAYSCVQKNSVWKDFLTREYQKDFDSQDLRIEAALAHLVPDGSASLIRQKLSAHANPQRMPFWSVKVENNARHQSLLDTSIQKSADILLNSLAMLAYTSTPALYTFWRAKFDFDALADWLISQQDGRHQFENALDTYFGLKALDSYRACQLTAASNDNINVNVSAENQTLRSFDQDELPLKFEVPTNYTSLQVTSYGDLRMVLGVRVLTEKRRRPKRDPTDNYPVSIKLTQQRDGSTSFFKQHVTIMSHSTLLSRLEIEHGLMTGFYTEPSWVQLTSRGVNFLIEPRVRSSAVNFVVTGLQKDREFSYEVRIGEPTQSYSPDYLAPFLITAKHHVVVGQQVILPKDLDFSQVEEFSRRKRFVPMLQRLTQSTNLIETVCIENGACTCAEGTCEVTCQSCGYVKVDDLCREFRRPFGFVVVFKFLSHREVQLDGGTFDVFDIHPYEFFGIEESKGSFSIWIRSCNTICKRATRDARGRFLLIGRSDGIFFSPMSHSNTTDTSLLHRHYLLRNEDRLAKASDCFALFSEFQENDCLSSSEFL